MKSWHVYVCIGKKTKFFCYIEKQRFHHTDPAICFLYRKRKIYSSQLKRLKIFHECARILDSIQSFKIEFWRVPISLRKTPRVVESCIILYDCSFPNGKKFMTLSSCDKIWALSNIQKLQCKFKSQNIIILYKSIF